MVDRRKFLAGAVGSAFAVPAAIGSGIVGANGAISLGFIGLGARGERLLSAFKKIDGVRITAVCDPDQIRLQKAATSFPNARANTDLREVIEASDIDAVVIASGNYWHCLAAIWACRAGKDVYVEKPLGHNLAEQQALGRVAEETGRLVQVGTQQRSDPAHKAARRWLHEEKLLGRLNRVIACRAGERKPIGARSAELSIPPTTDYGLWLGPAQRDALLRNQLHYDWHWDWNTGSGEMGNWGVHIIDDLRSVALNDKAELPTRVTSAGARVCWDDAGETPNLQAAFFSGVGLPVSLLLSNLNAEGSLAGRYGYRGPKTGYTVHGEGGSLAAQRGKYVLRDGDGVIIKQRSGNGGAGHQQNFIDAIRSRSPGLLNAPLAQGHASSSWCHLANIAALQGRASTEAGAVEDSEEWTLLAKALDSESKARGAGCIPAGQITPDSDGHIATSGLSAKALNLVSRIEPTRGFDPLEA